MQIRTLRYFVELARVGSFYAAAKALHISQQGLGRAMSSLEEELGTTLLERDRRGTALTSDGKILLSYARKILEAHDAMIDEIHAGRRVDPDSNKRVKVYVSYYSAQIAAMDPEYVGYLSKDVFYIEEPYEKLMKRAAASDGSDLVYLDLHPYSLEKMANNPDVTFSPTLKTRYGIVWRKGSPFESERTLDCAAVARSPIAMNTFRETAQYVEWLFRDTPLQNVRMGATSPLMLIEYVRSSEKAVALFDSFSFFLMKRSNPESMAELGFTPFSTPDAVCDVGFVFPRKARLSADALSSTRLLSQLLQKNCAAYFEEYPLR